MTPDILKDNMVNGEREISRRDLLKMVSPLGVVSLERAQCTGCGLCATECPTGALCVSQGAQPDSFKLLFKHNLCIACKQ